MKVLYKSIMISSLMIASAGVAEYLKPTINLASSRPSTKIEDLLPKQFGNWKVVTGQRVVLPAADVQANLDKTYSQIVARSYVNDAGYLIMLSVAYGGDQADGLTVHRPEICYPAQGFTVSQKGDSTITLDSGKLLPVTRLLTNARGRFEPVTYWVMNGDYSVSGERFSTRLTQLKYNFKGIIPDGMLIRVSSIDKDSSTAFAMQDEFAKSLLRSIAPASQPRFGA